MNFLFFDTETNGLPKRRNAPLSNTANWPNVVQLAWEIWRYESGTYTKIDQQSFIVKMPLDFVWDAGSTKIHSIDRERSERDGTPGAIVLDKFKVAASQCQQIIAHNMAFDKPVLQCEYIRINPSETFSWWPATELCTMEKTKGLLKLKSLYPKPSDPYKFPKLQELYTYLFPDPHSLQFHSADVDVACLVRCFMELARRNYISP